MKFLWTNWSLRSGTIFVCWYDVALTMISAVIFISLTFFAPVYLTVLVLVRTFAVMGVKHFVGMMLWRNGFHGSWAQIKYVVNTIQLVVQVVLDTAIVITSAIAADSTGLKIGLAIGLLALFASLATIDVYFIFVLYNYYKHPQDSPENVDVIQQLEREMQVVNNADSQPQNNQAAGNNVKNNNQPEMIYFPQAGTP
ncbi:unnamed protein product [Moneuplotes crassus]|uniref:Uncharacterized protein n=2 Tax=Euplotes crassus TaxID=5936 RepID=A0AAD1XS68_EUPCR|nr:unnamed protein product [Moneuplotes crassus]